MTLKIHWHTSPEEIADTIYLETDFAVLEMHFSGTVILKTTWRTNVKKVYSLKNSQIPVLQIINYLQNSDKIDLTVNLKNQGTQFSHRVWEELVKIPFSETLTYSALAKKVNSGPRAVANACRNNPFPGIIPCHRVISKSGIGGFMGHKKGEFIALKRRLLAYEAVQIKRHE